MDAVIIDAVRTPVGKLRGALSQVRPDDLAAYAIEQLRSAEFLVRNVGEIRAEFSGERVTLICTTNIA